MRNPEDHRTTSNRRDFLRLTGGGVCTWALVAQLAACDSTDPAANDDDDDDGTGVTVSGNTIRLDLSNSTLASLGSAGGFRVIDSAKTIVINVGGSNLRAFTSVCTHQGCDVDRFENSRIKCPCHGSEYDTSGAVVVGPAPAPLKEYSLTRNGDLVTITKS